MSLVDYAASSDEEDDDASPQADEGDLRPVEGEAEEQQGALPSKSPTSTSKPSPPSEDRSENARGLPPPSFEKFPDASLLLNDPTGSSSLYSSDHASWVAAAMAERASSRKREPPLLPSTAPCNKVPRATLPHTESVPDTVGRVLLPPQLRGRSNVVTEDLGKLFVKRHTGPPSG
ncbi:hypothetical protein MLD38_002768 [Melastoma candidum]|uniref:Uncharacterized protein n=1 Tax=Melastoma candidum TaxID=119954 RepID=A0ACB9RZP1_9MYRT|nr:hypothetical protein MLD38_002768 [Melastoma candidum]